MDKREIILYFKIVVRIIISAVIFIVILVLLNKFIESGKIEWKEFIEFISLCLLQYFIINPKISIKIPGVFEIKTELSRVEKQLSDVARNISNIKINIDSKQNVDYHPSIFTESAESDASTTKFIPEDNNTLTREVNKIN